jgi:antitoxin component HigA of HigAB toxin-antitoxin module
MVEDHKMSATAVRSEYGACSGTLPAVIRSEAENERLIRALEELDRKGNRMTAAERRLADLLTLLIEDFEEKHYALKPADPATVLTELIEASGLKQKISPIFSELQASSRRY